MPSRKPAACTAQQPDGHELGGLRRAKHGYRLGLRFAPAAGKAGIQHGRRDTTARTDRPLKTGLAGKKSGQATGSGQNRHRSGAQAGGKQGRGGVQDVAATYPPEKTKPRPEAKCGRFGGFARNPSRQEGRRRVFSGWPRVRYPPFFGFADSTGAARLTERNPRSGIVRRW